MTQSISGIVLRNMVPGIPPRKLQRQDAQPPDTAWLKTYEGLINSHIKPSTETHVVCGRKNDKIWAAKIDQSGDIEWENTYSNPEGATIDHSATSIDEIPEGGYLITTTRNILSETSNYGVIGILKLTEDGIVEWRKTYAQDRMGYLSPTVAANSNGFIIAGGKIDRETEDTAVFLTKFSLDGQYEKQPRLKKTHDGGLLHSVISLSNGGFLAAGNATIEAETHQQRGWVVKLSATGDIEWEYRHDHGIFASGHGLAETSDKSYVVVGYRDHEDGVGLERWIAKLDHQNGSLIWTESFYDESLGEHSEIAVDVVETPNNQLVTVGLIVHDSDAEQTNLSAVDANSAELNWQKEYSEAELFSGNDLFLTSNDELIVSGGMGSGTEGLFHGWMLQTESLTATSTPTTETPPEEAPPETVSSTVPYDLRAGTKTEITISDTTFYVIRDIPDVDPQRVAVTTPEYDLVAQPEARQAILINTYLNDLGYLSQFPEQARTSLIENAKRKAAAWSQAETAARLGDVAADILAAWASAHAGLTTHSYTEVLDALDSVIVWGADWAENPYKQQFTEMMMACRNVEWVKMETENVEDLSADAPGVAAVLTTLVKAYDAFEDTRDVLASWQLLRESAQTTGPTSDFLLVTGTIEIAKAAKGIFLGIILDKSFGEADDFFEITAEIDGIMHAYQTIRRSIHERLLEIETAAREGILTPHQTYEFEILNYTRHQLRAMAHHFAAQRIVELANDDLSLLWNAMINARTNYEQYTQIADAHAWLAKAHCISWGGREKSVRTRLNDSINTEIIEGSQ